MPIERDAFYALLGIAMRAGVLTLGESGVHKAISSGAARFALLDAGASDNTKKNSATPARFTTSSCLKRSRTVWGLPLASRGA